MTAKRHEGEHGAWASVHREGWNLTVHPRKRLTEVTGGQLDAPEVVGMEVSRSSAPILYMRGDHKAVLREWCVIRSALQIEEGPSPAEFIHALAECREALADDLRPALRASMEVANG